jgi:uncharacterized DUF497 family protein
MITRFRWIDWNRDKVAKHGVLPVEAERVVLTATRPYPRKAGGERWLVIGRGRGDRFVEVAYLIDPDRKTAFIIHAMPLTTRRRRG